MAFEKVVDLDAQVTTALGGLNKKTGKPNPKSAEGYYIGAKKVESRKAKSGFAYLHILQTPKGNLGVWGKTDMDRKMTQVSPGTMVRITHSGFVPTPNGDMYKFEVEQDPDNKITVSVRASDGGQVDGGSELYDTPAAVQDEDVDDDDSDNDLTGGYTGGNTLVASAAERKAKVEALLKKGRK